MREDEKKIFFRFFLFAFQVNRSFRKRFFGPKIIGVRSCLGELEGQKGWHLKKTKRGLFYFFFAFRVNRPRRKRFRRKKLGSDAAWVSYSCQKVQKPSEDFFTSQYLLASLSPAQRQGSGVGSFRVRICLVVFN